MVTGRLSERIAISIVCAALTGCEGPAAPETPVATGSWGGIGIRLNVTGTGATVDYDCANGTIDQPLVVDRDGRFSAAGTHVREHGGPIRVDEVLDRHPARYQGQLSGTSMKLNVTLIDAVQTIGPFDLTLGGASRVVKCL